MFLHSIFNSGSEEVSAKIISKDRIKLITVDKCSRLADSVLFVRNGYNWFSLNKKCASELESHLLDYALSIWHTNNGQAKLNIIAETLKITKYPSDLDMQRQTNSFQGKNWK